MDGIVKTSGYEYGEPLRYGTGYYRLCKAEGDCAVLRYEEQFDKVALGALTVTEEEQKEAEALVSEELKRPSGWQSRI